jgi:hypothetical protein
MEVFLDLKQSSWIIMKWNACKILGYICTTLTKAKDPCVRKDDTFLLSYIT